MPQKIRNQKPVKGGRRRLSSSIIPVLEKLIRDDARRFGVSRSFVSAVIYAQHYGVTDQELYAQPARPRLRLASSR